MILKVIYRGFKSFADIIEVDFSKGLTTVIGPNGCGKSNIVDGIRWVLGEQSAKSLRGGKMEDIIFFGTTKRKPSDLAEVTLILDNSRNLFKTVDTSEVSVTRRTFRKGGSEYLINGEISRLKDVQNLFLDSGIGSRSYSLIGQEQAKKILSTKIEERRAIFEEAAGIVKFKQQKEQTEKRLAEVDNNLTRMQDILHELEKQKEPLKKQSEKAIKYNELTTQLKTLEIQYLLNQYDVLKTEIVFLETEITEQTTTVEKMEKDLSEGDTLLSEIKQKYQEDNEELFSSQNLLAEKKEELDRIENEINILKERNGNSDSKLKDIVIQIEELESKNSLSLEEHTRKESRLHFVNDSIASNQQLLDGLNEKINSVENDKLHLVNNYEHYRQKSVDLYNNITQKQYERNHLKEKEQELKDKTKTVEDALSEIQNEYDNAKNLYDELKAEYDSLNGKKTTFSMELERKNVQFNDDNKLFETLSADLKSLKQKEFELKAKVENIENFMEKNEGFFDGVKAILNEKKKGNFSDVLGAFAELIKVDAKYEIAIDTLLQSSMQAIVTKDDKTAKNCINFLNKEKLGRATFLPINLAQSTHFSTDELALIEKTKGIQPSINGIDFSKEVAPVIEQRLGRSLIADNLDIALEFIKSSNMKVRISTIDGEIVQSGAITGGSNNRKKSNFFTKKRELEEAKNTLEMVLSDLTKNEEQANGLQVSLTTLKEKIKELSASLHTVTEELNERYAGLKDSENSYQRIHEKHQDLVTEQEELKINLKDAKDKIITLKFDIEKMENEHEATNAKLENLHSEKETQDGSLSSMLKTLNDTQTLLVRLEEEQKQLAEYMNDFSEDAVEVKEKLVALQTKQEEEIQSIKRNTVLINDYLNIFETIEKEYEALKTTLSESRKSTQSAVDNMNQLETEIKELRLEKESADKTLNKVHIKHSKKETEMQNVLQGLFEGYEISEENIGEFERQEIDMKNSKKEVEKLRKEIGSLGNINHNAIDEYQDISTRFETETTQFNDSKKAKADLMELISTIEVEMTTRFITTFDEIAKNFEHTFVKLFEGGSAKLKLVDEKNPLTSEIDIIAQPPGKAQKSISLLSGGEQALSAVALIFAIILAKPSPFIILDEVDAPLDDANVARFAKYLKELSSDNQFIVITHRKGTKMVSDFMYGVTHEELGVSVVAPLKLDFNDEKIG